MLLFSMLCRYDSKSVPMICSEVSRSQSRCSNEIGALPATMATVIFTWYSIKGCHAGVYLGSNMWGVFTMVFTSFDVSAQNQTPRMVVMVL